VERIFSEIEEIFEGGKDRVRVRVRVERRK